MVARYSSSVCGFVCTTLKVSADVDTVVGFLAARDGRLQCRREHDFGRVIMRGEVQEAEVVLRDGERNVVLGSPSNDNSAGQMGRVRVTALGFIYS